MTWQAGGAREELEIFPWDANFETGLEPVDAQHKRLVALLNELVCSMSGQGGRKDPEGLAEALAELRGYAATHFACEEKIWSEGFGEADDWVLGHESSHGDFCAKIEAMAQSEDFRNGLQSAREELAIFLAHWLALHIIESDKAMALALRALSRGKSPQEAKKEAKEQMAGAARAMIDAIMGMYDKLAQRTMRLSSEMELRRQAQEELMRAQEQLTLATERAQRANAEKSLYLAKMSHELRLPLSSAAGLADMLASQGNLEGKALEWALAIGQCAGHMLSVVSSILDMSKIEAGKMQLNGQTFEVCGLGREALDICAPLARASGVELRWEEAAGPLLPAMEGDAQKIKQCLINLLNNAIKASPKGAQVKARAEAFEEHGGYLLRWSVADSGPGLDAASMQALFAEFGSGFAQGGTGLGLAIVKSFSEMMGGRAWAESEPGRGSVFYFEARAKAAEARCEASKEPAGEPWLRGKRVILAEDDDISALVALDALGSAGASAERACSGAQALELWSAGGADLVLLDMRMPGMDGPECARLLRARGADCPILALTANAFDEDRKICLESGMDGFLTKPAAASAIAEAAAGSRRRGA